MPLIPILMLCAFQSVPGWGLRGVDFDLEPSDYFKIAVVCGFVGGALGAKYRVLGAFAGALCTAGGFAALHALLLVFNRIFGLVLLIGMFLGMLPAAILYTWVEMLLDRLGYGSEIPPGGPPTDSSNHQT